MKKQFSIYLLFSIITLSFVFIISNYWRTSSPASYSLKLPDPRTQVAALEGASSGLVGWWKFDEGSGTTTIDVSRNGNDGTLMNDPVWVDGKFGKAIQFTGGLGKAQYVKLAKPVGFDQWSVSLWVKPVIPFPANRDPYYGNYTLLSTDTPFGFAVTETGINIHPAQIAPFDFKGQADQWHHIVFGFDGKNSFAVVDNKVFGVQPIPNTFAKVVTRGIGSKLGNITNNFNGIIDDVRLYSRVLTDQEIATLHDPTSQSAATPITQTVTVSSVTNATTSSESAATTASVSADSPSVSLVSGSLPDIHLPSWARYSEKPITFTTKAFAICKYSLTPNTDYSKMSGIIDTDFITSHILHPKGLLPGTNNKFYIRCSSRTNTVDTADAVASVITDPDTTLPSFWRINAPMVTEDVADIVWSTTEISDGQLEWGTTQSYGNVSALELSKAIPHAVFLRNLEPATTYHYRVKSRDVAGNLAVSEDHTFTTKPRSTTVNYYVSTTGSDTTGDGSLSKPFVTLVKARDTVRAYKGSRGLPPGGITVWLRGGKYFQGTRFDLTSADSGTADSPITYRSYPGEVATITGGKKVVNWTSASNSPLAIYLNPAVAAHVYVTDLKAQNISYLATMDGSGEKYGMQFIFNGQPMILARYPNNGYVNIGNVADKSGIFNYIDSEPGVWHDTSNLWLSGYFYHGWSHSHNKVASLNKSQKLITMTQPSHGYGFRTGQWYQYENMIEELDAPGEWYLDAASGLLYFYPPSDIQSGEAEMAVGDYLIYGSSASYVTFRDLIVENARSIGLSANGGTDFSVINCVIRNMGNSGVNTGSGSRNTIVYKNTVYNIGGKGLSISSGSAQDSGTLIPTYSEIISNKVYHTGIWFKTPFGAIMAGGIEAHISNNEIFDAPYLGIGLSGPNNNNIVEFNHIYDVMKLATDGGAIYYGREWTKRGTIIRYNYIHDIYGKDNFGAESIYLDDTQAGQTVWGNVISNASATTLDMNSSSGSGLHIGGGRDNIIENNIVVNLKMGSSIGVWYSKANDAQAIINTVNYKAPPFTTMYPELSNLNSAGELFTPLGSTLKNNVFSQNYGVWLYQLYNAHFESIIDIRDNLSGPNLSFTSTPIGNFGLPSNSPVFATGFKPIPYEKIGLSEKTSIAFISNTSLPTAPNVPPMQAVTIVSANSQTTSNSSGSSGISNPASSASSASSGNSNQITSPSNSTNTSGPSGGGNISNTMNSYDKALNSSLTTFSNKVTSGSVSGSAAKKPVYKQLANNVGKDDALLTIPTTAIDITLPKVPSWIDVIWDMIVEVGTRIKMGAEKTVTEVKGLLKVASPN